MSKDVRVILRSLVDLRDRQIQKARIQFSLRLDALEKNDEATERQKEVLTRYFERLRALEDDLDVEITEVVREIIEEEPICQHLLALKGIGPIYIAQMWAMIDIERAPMVSSLWRYAGYGVVNGQRERAVKGERRHYNQRLKITLRKVGSSFLRCDSPYRAIYDEAREKYDREHPEWTKGHQYHAALDKMIKHFLCHLWERWRILEGLEVRGPYVQDVLGHQHISRPEDFGWPDLEVNL